MSHTPIVSCIFHTHSCMYTHCTHTVECIGTERPHEAHSPRLAIRCKHIRELQPPLPAAAAADWCHWKRKSPDLACWFTCWRQREYSLARIQGLHTVHSCVWQFITYISSFLNGCSVDTAALFCMKWLPPEPQTHMHVHKYTDIRTLISTRICICL